MFRYIILITFSALAFAENSADTFTFGNGVYDYAEILTVDHNGNGIWDDIVEEVLGDNPNTFEVENDFILVEAVPADEFIDVDGDLLWDVAEEFTDVNANGVWDDVILGDDPATIDFETDFVLVPAEPWVDNNIGVNDLWVNPDCCWYEEWYIPIEDYYEIFEGDNLTLDATPEHLVYLDLHPIFINEDFDGDGTLDISEDLNQNGILDSGEDIDGDGFLDIDEDIDGDNNLDLNTEIFVDQNTNTVYLKNGLSDQDILEFDINDHYSIEPFVDVGNGVYDEGEEFIDTLNGVYDEGEPFVDGNGVYDEGEEFVDVANGVWDDAILDENGNILIPAEEFTDTLNGVYDEGESFVDLGNGVYDEGEPFTDSNGNGEWDEIFQEWWIWPPGDNPPGPPVIVPPGPPVIWPPGIIPPEIGPPIIIPPDAERFTYQWYYPIPGDPIGFPIPAEFGGTNARYNIQGIKANEGNWRVEVTDHQPENWFIIYDDDTLVFDFNRYTDILEDNEVSRDWIPGIGWSITRSRSFEVRVVKDSDNDGLYDYVETDTGEYVSPTNTGTNPYNSDTDFDTLSDGYEITIGTNPNLFDTDSDGLSDYAETNTGEFISAEDTGTNPLAYDTSGDGLNDGEVVGVGFDPNVDYTPLLNLSSINMTQEVKDLRPGSVTIQVIDGEANINMDIESSTDLENWEIDSAITVPMQIEEGEATKFFRFKMAE